MPRAALALAVVLAAALALAGCGRRGKLEPPPDQPGVTTPGGKTVDPGIQHPKKPFVLDPLLN